MEKIKFYARKEVPLEMHRTRIIQRLNLLPIKERKEKIEAAGYNTFLLYNKDIFLDMLTDSGVNAMSNEMQSAMLKADDSYAGSQTYLRMAHKLEEIFGMQYFLPVHQGRAGEHILITKYVKKGDKIPMNIRFDSIKDFLKSANAELIEVLTDEAYKIDSKSPFKGNFDLEQLEKTIVTYKEKIPFVRIEAGSNLIGGQPISYTNIFKVSKLCRKYNIKLILDASLLQDNLYYIKTKEECCKELSLYTITKKIANCVDIIYFSGRKFGFARGGGICVRDYDVYKELERLVPKYEGFLTYGGMSVSEMEALTVGFEETMDLNVISQAPRFIEYMVKELSTYGIPVVKPAGGLGVHIDAKNFLERVKLEEYPAGALAAAIYLCGGIRTMERGTISEDRNADGTNCFPKMELVRIALPRRVFTLSQIEYTIDRLKWLYDNRELIGGLKFYEEPKELRFYFGKLMPTSNWPDKLIAKYQTDFCESL